MAHNYEHAEHDELTSSKKVTVVGGSISAAGQVTVTPLQAWPDPKTYIGLVTITGSLSAAAGNITLDPGSQTQIKGNLTLSDSKGFIGLTTTVIGSAPTIFAVVNTAAAGQSSVVLDNSVSKIGFASVTPVAAWPDPKGYIGLVTITGSLAPAAGNITLDPGSRTGIIGNVTITDSKGYIGLVTATLDNSRGVTFSGNVTLDAGSKTQIVGNITLTDSKTFIGLVTSVIGSSPSVQAFGQFFPVLQSMASGGLGPIALDNFGRVQTTQVGTVTIQDGGNSITIDGNVGVLGNVTLSDAKTFIGLTTSTLGASPAFIGIVTVTNASIAVTQSGTWDEVGINDSGNSITVDGSVSILGNVTVSDSKGFIGLTTSTLGASPAFIGIVTITNKDRTITGNVTLSDAKTFVGLVTAVTVNGGSNKTLIHKTIAFAQASVATIAVPTNTFKITHLLLNSNASVRVNIKSGATYLTGNVSIGVSLNPGGGWVENGSVEAPIYVGLAAQAGIVVEKFDTTGTSAQISGKLIYFDE